MPDLSPPGIVLSFDFGMKNIGTAVGQSITRSATPLQTLKAQNGIPRWEEIAALIEKWKPEAILVGLPLQMDGSLQPMTLCARRFMNRLRGRFQLPVFEVDERLTSWEAKQRSTLKPSKHKQKRIQTEAHSYAAVILIEQWMNDSVVK